MSVGTMLACLALSFLAGSYKGSVSTSLSNSQTFGDRMGQRSLYSHELSMETDKRTPFFNRAEKALVTSLFTLLRNNSALL